MSGGISLKRLQGRRPVQRQRGIALVIVLCLILLMSVLAAGHSRNSHVETRLATRQVESGTARHVAEAAVNMAILELLHRDVDAAPPADGRRRELRFDDRDLVLSVRRASGLVDLNGADESLLAAVFAAAGADADAAVAVAAATIDWRDADEQRRLNGAEAGEYGAAGLPFGAANRNFASVDELRYVFGMTPELFRASAAYFTVHSGEAGLDLDLAPDFLVEALTGKQLQQRQRPVAGRVRTGAFHINAAVRGSMGVLVSCEAVVLLTGKTERPYSVLEWRENSRLLAEPEESEDI
ncbi:MAG: general secretion pathway protein GspK [Gammaproteobacteria bacterium]|nr:general secretion pathway protein GspK [Gammaproteobacteria bacterium]MDH4253163.1 general secretion pathway protein GspK [Gammaproteobacteria bacterium]